MGLELVAAIVAAIACGGIAMILRKLTRGRLPTWIVPAAAALGLISYTAWSEYSWYGRMADALPEGVAVVWADDRPQALRPWTMAVPLVTRFVALDTREMLAHPANPDLIMANAYGFARWRGVEQWMMAVDCAGERSVRMSTEMRITDAGVLEGGEWVPFLPEDQTGVVACRRSG